MSLIATAATTAVLRALAAPTLTAISDAIKSNSHKIRAQFENTFTNHLELTYNRCASVRTIFSNEEYISLESIYVNLHLSCGNKRVRDDEIVSLNDDYKNIVVIGTGGAGKTMLMRHIALGIYNNPVGQIPLFIELRQLPDYEPESFYRTIFNMITPERDQGNYSLFLEGLRAGIFILQLDGLDEVPPARREQVFRSIQRIPLDFPDIQIIASTRPEIDVRSWEHFSAYKVEGFTIDQARLLIQKIEYPDDLKSKFLNLLNDEFYRKHETFLSVPLLCTLMLITFNEFRDIPSRVTVFYEQAFETLYRRHDTAKEGFFKRTFHSNLSSDRFRFLFSAFCYRTLALNEVSFSDDKLRRHLAKAAEVTEIDVNIDDYASDLVSSVCMIMRDGLNLHFIHRSFQDYFAALYILRYRGPDSFEVYDRVVTDMFISNIVEMAADIDLQTLEREWALPAVRKIDRRLKRTKKSERPFVFIRGLFYDLRVDGNPPSRVSGWSWTRDQPYMKPLQALAKIYPKEYGPLIGPSAFMGQLVDADLDICTLPSKGIELPDELNAFCESKTYAEIGDEYIEINTANMPNDWLKFTEIYARVESCIGAIGRLHKFLQDRVTTRDNISILD